MTEFGLELHRVWFRGRAEEQRTYCGGLYKTPKHFSCGKYARLRMAKRRLIILNFSRKFSGKTFGGFSKRRIFAASFQKAIIARPLEGRLAQLVQSICLTSRGSGVRIPQRPPIERDAMSSASLFLFHFLTLFASLRQAIFDRIDTTNQKRTMIFGIFFIKTPIRFLIFIYICAGKIPK